jgi:hypothetical protein
LTVPRSFTSIERRARVLAKRAAGFTIKEACLHADVTPSTFHRIRKDLGPARFDAILAELRLLHSQGLSLSAVTQRGIQLFLGAETTRETAAATEQPLTWKAIEKAARDLFRSKAQNSRAKLKARYEHFASSAYTGELRTKVAAFLGCSEEDLDAQPAAALLRATWVACRGIEGVNP